eukprot:scaffold3065_cov389-Prasinococcus_capsulatus_cf.AAC.12
MAELHQLDAAPPHSRSVEPMVVVPRKRRVAWRRLGRRHGQGKGCATVAEMSAACRSHGHLQLQAQGALADGQMNGSSGCMLHLQTLCRRGSCVLG